MKGVRNCYKLLLIISLSVFAAAAQTTKQPAKLSSTMSADPQKDAIGAEFATRAKAYVAAREKIDSALPPMPKQATAEQIEEHKTSLLTAVQKARKGERQGNIFTPAASAMIRSIINNEFKGQDREYLRKKVYEAENKNVKVAVNTAYPEAAEQLEMPPNLLLALPQLPKQVRYRFVGTYLLLVDRENNLIIDYMTDALPSGGGVAPVAANSPQTTAQTTVPPSTTAAEVVSVAPASATNTSSVALPSPLTLPMKEGSLRMMVIGDMGSGKPMQYETAKMMNTFRQAFPFDTVLTVGDNIYGSDKAADMETKFQEAYQPLLDQGVKFYATLGNHDSSNQRFYQFFNMNGQEYYQFEKDGVSFYALDSTYMDKKQLDWLTSKLQADTNKWKIAFFHHPPFSSGGFHGSDTKMRAALHPLFVKYGVDVVFTGHDHFYERIKPQDGVQYFVTGSGGQLRKGDIKSNSPLTAKAFDTDNAFLLFEISGDQMYFQVLSRTGQTVDSGTITRRGAAATASMAQAK